MPPVKSRTSIFITWLLTLAVLGGGAAGAWYWFVQMPRERAVATPAPRFRPAATVGVAQATRADVPVVVSAIGTVQPVVTATVRTQLAGILVGINFTEGQMVTKGQVLAQMDARPYRLALAQAQANLARDQAQLADAQRDLGRYRTLLAQDSIARQQVDTQASLVKQLENTVAADEALVGTARLNLEYTTITAPVAGRIGLRQADIGNYLTPGDANGIAVITQLDPIDVIFAVPQDRRPALQARIAGGAPLPVLALDQQSVATLAEGTFLTFDNVVDATSGTVKAKARFANTDGRLFPNQFVNVRVRADTIAGAITVPVSAVRHGARGAFVFALNADRTVSLRQVTTGIADGDRIVILSGISEGERVVSEGADNLVDGAQVVMPGDGPRERPPGAGGGGGRQRP
ncbi:MAG: efflux RND transporter periplasmic adaptor subunit [Alphaproteobacteria bacterium]|nr:efflux RND transporter periplasmic adaptor subunit [Alphaproteobacteria bacterium]